MQSRNSDSYKYDNDHFVLEIGQHIVEFEQQGNAMAKYGTSMQVNLSKLLRIKLGKGYSCPNLNNMRKFYFAIPFM